jgi:hypothetical protein
MLLVVGTVLHAYVVLRAASVPVIARRVSLPVRVAVGVGLWLLYLAASLVGHDAAGPVGRPLALFGVSWLTALFLVAVPMLLVDLVTGFGLLLPRMAPRLRGWALVAGGLLVVIAVVQGLRPPVVSSYEVRLAGLPAERDGTVIVAVSDLHLGGTLGLDWLAARVDQVQALRPDVVVVLGDVFEGHGGPDAGLLAQTRRLSAPLGVWAVTGNHEFHGRTGTSDPALDAAGFAVLHDRWVQLVPGLVVAGVDDLTSRRRAGTGADAVSRALERRPAGATVLLSHTPWQAEQAAAAGVGLMLCGHTHGGQVWPFSYLVARRYPLLQGRHEVDGMAVIVSRGAGTWGPRMRLWRPGEIVRVTLRAASAE